MRRRPRAPALAVALLLTAAAPAAAEGTEAALRILLAGSSLPVPPSPSCQGIRPAGPRPTIGDLLAIPLAGLDGGTNRVGGGCDRGRCRVRITHRAGEDVFFYEYRFRAARGRLVPASLECFSTP